MAPTRVADDSADKNSGVSNAKRSCLHSKVKEEEIGMDEYETDSDDSNCSVTSAIKDVAVHREELIELFVDPQSADVTVSQVADSADTTWTDDKHSSYLNSIEATFVQKMYDKKYCSLDLCGHFSPSSVSGEQECVESHPFGFSKRQQLAGGLQCRALMRPWLLTPSVLASPWIQHFKSKQAASVNDSEIREEGNGRNNVQSWRACGSAKVLNSSSLLEENSDIHTTPPSAVRPPSFQLASKKRGVSFSIPDCKKSVIQSRGYNLPAQDITAGMLKKNKCRRTLSKMDMEMEEEFMSKQQSNDKHDDADIESGKDDLNLQQTQNPSDQSKTLYSDDNKGDEVKIVKEKQSMLMGCEMALSNGSFKEPVSLKKLDQVVPFFKDAGTEEGYGQSMVPEVVIDSFIPNSNDGFPSSSKELSCSALPCKHVVLEQVTCRTLLEAGVHFQGEGGLVRDLKEVQSGSKTWTWGIQGPRQQLNGKSPRALVKFST